MHMVTKWRGKTSLHAGQPPSSFEREGPRPDVAAEVVHEGHGAEATEVGEEVVHGAEPLQDGGRPPNGWRASGAKEGRRGGGASGRDRGIWISITFSFLKIVENVSYGRNAVDSEGHVVSPAMCRFLTSFIISKTQIDRRIGTG